MILKEVADHTLYRSFYSLWRQVCHGLADWKSFFTVDATPGDWQVMAEASSGGESAQITRTIELAKLNVTAFLIACKFCFSLG